ncbi:MAG: aminotransferase class I/II-fold pyridoxal phosphate-dependent enzyme [Gemmataceae bacterium]
MILPIHRMAASLSRGGICRILEHFERLFPDDHMKDLVVDAMPAGREIALLGRKVVNFGSDSFLGLDADPRVQAAIIRGVERWGTHNGSSRFFASVRVNVDAEERLARWLGTEASVIYPSVTLANLGAIPGLVGPKDIVVSDTRAHNSIGEGIKIARANGTRTFTFAHDDVADLVRVFESARPYRHALVAIDGVYSMTGTLPPLGELDEVCRLHDAVLYVDDAHGTGVLGERGRGTVLDALGSYDNVLVVGSLSKAFSAAGGFIGCPEVFQRILKMTSNTYIFGGPVTPPYLEAVCAVLEILDSPEYDEIKARLDANLSQLVNGARRLGLSVMGGLTPIVSVLVGDEIDTLKAGRFLFERGYYVQSVTFPAVPYHEGVLRIQVNANHTRESIAGLLAALAELRNFVSLARKHAG